MAPFPIAAILIDDSKPERKIDLFIGKILLQIYQKIKDDFSNTDIIELQEEMRSEFKRWKQYPELFSSFDNVEINHFKIPDKLRDELDNIPEVFDYFNEGRILKFIVSNKSLGKKILQILEQNNVTNFTIHYGTWEIL
jgi:hypothetical protein